MGFLTNYCTVNLELCIYLSIGYFKWPTFNAHTGPVELSGLVFLASRVASQMAPYSLYSALLLNKAWSNVEHDIGNKVPFGMQPPSLPRDMRSRQHLADRDRC
jgi:hypothetical protein